MANLKVDFAILESIRRSAAQITAEFEDLNERRETDAVIWGGYQVRSAMDDFASNWHIHREALSEQIRTLGEKCSGVAETFRAVEQVLSQAAQQGPS